MLEKDQLKRQLRFKDHNGNDFADWEVKTLGEVAEIIMGQSPDSTSYNSEGNGKPLIQGNADIQNRKSNPRNWTTQSTKECKIGDLILTVRAPVGAVAKSIHNACIGRGVCLIRNNSKSDIEFIFQFLLDYETKWGSLEQGSTFTAVSGIEIKKLKIPIPTLEEQTKIANFLSSIDEKITKMEQELQELKSYKKGVMQQIFSQELRFKDDNGNEFADWEEKKLGDVFYSEKGKGISKNKIINDGKYKCILYGELYTKYNEVVFGVISKTNEVDGIKSKIGDLLIPSSTTTTGIDLANVTALNEEDVLLGGDITVLRSNEKVYNVFYAYYLSNHKKDEIASYAQGSTIVHLYYSHIKSMMIDIPCLAEQTKIANFLSAIDEKISHCQAQIANTEVWKKGLLQQMFV